MFYIIISVRASCFCTLSPKTLPVFSRKADVSLNCWQGPIFPISIPHRDSLFGTLTRDVTFAPLQLHHPGASFAFLPLEGILNFALAYYHIKHPSWCYVTEKSDKCSS